MLLHYCHGFFFLFFFWWVLHKAISALEAVPPRITSYSRPFLSVQNFSAIRVCNCPLNLRRVTTCLCSPLRGPEPIAHWLWWDGRTQIHRNPFRTNSPPPLAPKYKLCFSLYLVPKVKGWLRVPLMRLLLQRDTMGTAFEYLKGKEITLLLGSGK